MKLLTKLQRYYIAFTPIALIACGIAGYFIISSFSPQAQKKDFIFTKQKPWPICVQAKLPLPIMI